VPWPVDITVLRHGVTPLEGIEPTVIITSARTRSRRCGCAAVDR
jgi:hypothetical protein